MYNLLFYTKTFLQQNNYLFSKKDAPNHPKITFRQKISTIPPFFIIIKSSS